MTEFNYCRLCAELNSKSDLLTLNKDTFSTNLNINFIFQYFPIQIDLLDDHLPKTICSNCCEQSNLTYEFYRKIQNAQEVLRDIFENREVKASIKLESNHNDYVAVKNENEINDDLDDSRSNLESPIEDVRNNDDWIKSNNSESVNSLSSSEEVKEENSKTTRSRSKRLASNLDQSNSKGKYKKKARNNQTWKDYVWICSVCSRENISKAELENHFKSDHNDKQLEYMCMECSKKYTKFNLFRRHVQIHRHKFRYRCDICNKYFHLKDRYEIHMKHMHDLGEGEKIVCSICGKIFKWPASLKSHIRFVHKSDDEKPQYECEICHKQFFKPSSLFTHKQLHEDTKKYTCDQCGVSFRQKGNLKQHIIFKHTDVKYNLHCTMCPKVFKNPYVLKKHQKSHLNVEIYKCEKCHRCFKHHLALKRHGKVHTDIFPYECSHCQKRFRENQDLKIHIRQHTGERPYSCLECNHHFSNNSNFIKHLKGRHKLTNFSIKNQHQYPFKN